MADPDPRLEKLLRQGFRRFNRFMLLLWRLGLGGWLNAWPPVGGRIMVLSHRGRRTGLRHRTPLNYAIIDGAVYCLAGFGPGSDWYRNLMATPQIELWLPDGWWAGQAEDVSDAPDRLPLLRQVLVASGFAARVAGIDPTSMSDEALAAATADYRLIRIRRAEARTGPGGPGDLAWVWPAIVFLLPCMWLYWRGGKGRSG